MSKMIVTIAVDLEDSATHPRNWDWVELVGMGTEYISSEEGK